MVRRRRNQHHARDRVAEAGDVGGHLAGRKLSTFAGLGALGNLDLELVGVHQVIGGHAEAGGSDLLHAVVGLALLCVDTRIFAAFARVAAAAEAVHGDGKRAMRFGRDCPERHSLRAEAT